MGTEQFSEMAAPVPIEDEPLSEQEQAAQVAEAKNYLDYLEPGTQPHAGAITVLRWAATLKELRERRTDTT